MGDVRTNLYQAAIDLVAATNTVAGGLQGDQVSGLDRCEQ